MTKNCTGYERCFWLHWGRLSRKWRLTCFEAMYRQPMLTFFVWSSLTETTASWKCTQRICDVGNGKDNEICVCQAWRAGVDIRVRLSLWDSAVLTQLLMTNRWRGSCHGYWKRWQIRGKFPKGSPEMAWTLYCFEVGGQSCKGGLR